MRFNNQQIKMPKSPVITRDMSCSTITSMPFYQNSPVYIQEVIPGDKVSIGVENFVRLNVMRSPTFGRCTIRNRVFFVPLRTLWNRFDEFITQQSKNSSSPAQLQSVPVLYEVNLIYLFASVDLGYVTEGTSDSFDITYLNSSGVVNYRKFTRKGRYLYRILVNLGYNINFGYHSSSQNTVSDGRTFSALPLLAYYRIWCDFFQYKMSETYREYDNTLPSTLSNYINSATLIPICEKLTLWGSLYDDDYFTLAGQSPNIPIYGDNPPNSYTLPYNIDANMANYDGVGSSEANKVEGSVASGAESATGSYNSEPTLISGSFGFGASALNFLHRAADYFQRKFRGGSTVVQQYFNEYGIELKAEEITHSKHLGSFETPVTISDVVGTSDQNFGAQTSLGRGAGVNRFTWNADEFGYIIVTSVVVAHGAYNHGTPRLATRISPLEFYHEDFDGLGMEAIRNDELSSGSVTKPTANYVADNTFGFIPTYGSYKVGHDTLSGDFIVRSTRSAYEGYYLSRKYLPEDYTSTPPVAGETFRNPNAYQNGWTPTQFDNIFLTSDLDNFLLFFNFDVKVANSVRPLLDSYDWYADGETKNMQGGANAFGDN